MMKIIKGVLVCCLSILLVTCQKGIDDNPNTSTGKLKLTFKNMVAGTPMQLNTGIYTNGSGEQYNITKFKYYISNISLNTGSSTATNNGYYLLDESDPASLSITIDVPVNIYSTISFLLGVDSSRNVSGAQTGALDPLNDMFWTWNSGYIMAKMEGNSPQSPVVNNKVEYHIGGFSGANNVLKNINLAAPPAPFEKPEIRENKTTEIFINADFNTWWQGSFSLKIADNPAVIHPGSLAKGISDNYAAMFSITDIKNY